MARDRLPPIRAVSWKRKAMKIEHIALWADDIEALKSFYVKYFDAKAGRRYSNPAKAFSSYFLGFDSHTRLEIMQSPSVTGRKNSPYGQTPGYAHIAFSVGSEDKVNALTRWLAQDGFEILDGPRRTGDGYYESVVLDPENNRIEITV